MSPFSHTEGGTGHHDVIIARHFDAPRELVFRAWTERAHLERWFAPPGCTIEFHDFDLRVGGGFRSCIHTPDHKQCWARATFRELIAPRRLVFAFIVTNAAGQPVDPVSIGMDPAWPRETVVTVTFSEQAGKTGMALHQTVDETLARKTGAYPSWLQMFDRLADEVERSKK